MLSEEHLIVLQKIMGTVVNHGDSIKADLLDRGYVRMVYSYDRKQYKNGFSKPVLVYTQTEAGLDLLNTHGYSVFSARLRIVEN